MLATAFLQLLRIQGNFVTFYRNQMPHELRGHDIQKVASHEDDQSDDKVQGGYDVAHNGVLDGMSDDL